MAESARTFLLLVFAGVACGVLALAAVLRGVVGRRRGQIDRRIRAGGAEEAGVVLEEALAGPGGLPWTRRLGRRARDWAEQVDLGLSAGEIAALIVLAGAVLAALVYFWRQGSDETARQGWLAVPAFFVGSGVALWLFGLRQAGWRRRMQDQLPDMIFLMARSLRAGLSLDQSIGLLGTQGPQPLSGEFRRMHSQLDMGLALPQVLQSASRRIRLTDFNVLASVLGLYRTTGGNLAAVMDRLARITRDHNQLRSYWRTTTALGRVTVPIAIALVLLVLFYLVFYQEEFAARYVNNPAGLTLFLVAGGLILAGIGLLFVLMRDQPD